MVVRPVASNMLDVVTIIILIIHITLVTTMRILLVLSKSREDVRMALGPTSAAQTPLRAGPS